MSFRNPTWPVFCARRASRDGRNAGSLPALGTAPRTVPKFLRLRMSESCYSNRDVRCRPKWQACFFLSTFC